MSKFLIDQARDLYGAKITDKDIEKMEDDIYWKRVPQISSTPGADHHLLKFNDISMTAVCREGRILTFLENDLDIRD